jgi:hypothetical protein
MEVSGQLHAPAALPSAKEPLIPIGWEAGWAPKPVWMRWWKKFSAPAGTRTLDHAACSPVLYHWATSAPRRQKEYCKPSTPPSGRSFAVIYSFKIGTHGVSSLKNFLSCNFMFISVSLVKRMLRFMMQIAMWNKYRYVVVWWILMWSK